MNKLRFLFSASLLLIANRPLVGAEVESPVAAIDALIGNGEFQEAFELAATYLDALEGEVEFDFLYGWAALESGNPNEAVFALERVSAVAEDDVLRERARLELARAYFVTNNLGAAESLFNGVLENDPPPNVQQNIQAFLLLIEARRDAQEASINWTISSVIGYDDNINSATSNAFIDTPLIGEVELNPDGQETADSFLNTSATMLYTYPFTRDRSVSTTVSLMHLDNFSTDQFDIDSLRGELAYNWGNETNRIKHGITANKVNLDQNGFQDSMGINTSWQRAARDGWYQSIAAAYSKIRYDTSNSGDLNDLRDVNQLLFTGGLTKIAGAFTHSLNIYHADEDAQMPDGGSHNGRAFTGLAYSLLFRLDGQHTPYLRASVQDVEHDSEHPVFFDTIREDEMGTVAIGWFWQFGRSLMLAAEASYTNNRSNIELFDYSRFKHQAGFRYQF